MDAIEQLNAPKLKTFRKHVLTHICKFFVDSKDIKLAVHETLAELQRTHTFSGWISGRDVPTDLLDQLARLMKENEKLRAAAARSDKDTSEHSRRFAGRTMLELFMALHEIKIEIPMPLSGNVASMSLVELFVNNGPQLASGVTNGATASPAEIFLFKVAQRLAPFGLVEHAKVPSRVSWVKFHNSKLGNEFLTEAHFMRLALEKKEAESGQMATEPAQTTSSKPLLTDATKLPDKS
jgi:hypothetical protein